MVPVVAVAGMFVPSGVAVNRPDELIEPPPLTEQLTGGCGLRGLLSW